MIEDEGFPAHLELFVASDAMANAPASRTRSLHYNVIGCARQRRSRGRAHTRHRAESCPSSEAPSFFDTGSRRVMTEQGTPDARKNAFETEVEVASATTSFKGNYDDIPPAHLCCAPKPPPLLFSTPARQSQNDHLPTLGECLHIPCIDAVPLFCREPAHARFCVSTHTTGSQPTALWRAHRLDPATAATGLQELQ